MKCKNGVEMVDVCSKSTLFSRGSREVLSKKA